MSNGTLDRSNRSDKAVDRGRQELDRIVVESEAAGDEAREVVHEAITVVEARLDTAQNPPGA